MNTHRTPDKGGSTSLKIWLIVAGCLLGMSSLISLELRSWPWDVQWLVNWQITDPVWRAIGFVRYELAGVLLITLNFVLLVLGRRSANAALELVPLPSSAEPDNDAGVSIDSATSVATYDSKSEADELSNDELVTVPNADSTQRSEGIDQALSAQGVVLPGGADRVSQGVVKSSNTVNFEAQIRIATDEIARLRRELVSCKQQLVAANNAKAQLLAGMSHELRTPMNGIMGMAELLLNGSLSEREQRFATSISSSASTLLSIINDLLDFSKVESGTLQLETTRFSVRDCVEDVSNLLAAKAHAKNIELICYVDDNVANQMDGDPARIRQILNNLIDNAIAFTHEGEVVVRLTRKPDAKGKSFYQCDVQDTGVGISPELQMQLFKTFMQADNSTVSTNGGLGMGLTIASQLVSLMNGEISFSSRLGEGSRFRFTMELDDVVSADAPKSSRHKLQDVDVPSDENSLPLVNARVLLVEDNPVNQDVAMGMLEQLGCQVSLAINGTEAISKGAEEKFDIVLMDCQMPLMDGYEATRRIKSGNSINAPTPIVALTANAMDGDREKCLMAGMDDYVSKPVRTQILSHMLDKWVGKPVEPSDQSLNGGTPTILATGVSGEVLTNGIVKASDGDAGDRSLPDVQSVTHELALTDSLESDVEQASVSEERIAPEQSLDIINFKAINVIRGLQRPGKPDLLSKVVGVYFDKTPEVISHMRSGLENQDFALISASAHSLKSSSAYLGADLLSKHCRTVESAITADRHDELQELIEAIAECYEESAMVLKELTGASDEAA